MGAVSILRLGYNRLIDDCISSRKLLLRSLGVRIFFIIVIIVLDNKSYKCLANETEYIDEQLHNDDVDKRDYLRVMRSSPSKKDYLRVMRKSDPDVKRDYLRVMRNALQGKRDYLRVMRRSDPDKRDYLRVMRASPDKKDYLRVMRNIPDKRDYLRVMRRSPVKRDNLRVMRSQPEKRDYLRVMRSDPDDQWLSYDDSPQEDSEIGGSPSML